MIRFTKMHGIGNDFVVVDAERCGSESGWPDLARAMCHRRFGVGSDGLLLISRATNADFQMRMLNPDGSESEMCGNGVRCVLRWLHREGWTQEPVVSLETGAGVLQLELTSNGWVRVDMGLARLLRGEIGMSGDPQAKFADEPLAHSSGLNGTAVSMGNPHLVVIVDDVKAVPLEVWGPELEAHSLFPNRVNVHFVQVLTPTSLRQRTWERGAGATLACGTGACAATVAAHVTGRSDSAVNVELPGGNLKIEYAPSGHVFMAGPAEFVFEGGWLEPDER